MKNGRIDQLEKLEAELKECRAVLRDVKSMLAFALTDADRKQLIRYIERVLEKTKGGQPDETT